LLAPGSNFCDTVQLPLTDGQQIVGGSCNPTPMCVAVPGQSHLQARQMLMTVERDQRPFQGRHRRPGANAVVQVHLPGQRSHHRRRRDVHADDGDPQPYGRSSNFSHSDAVLTASPPPRTVATGSFVNPQTNYFGAPAQTDGQGTLIGHSHAVIEQIASLDATTPNDPRDFAFFKGLNDAARESEWATESVEGCLLTAPCGFSLALCRKRTASSALKVRLCLSLQSGSRRC
jgi:hypothetical protein